MTGGTQWFENLFRRICEAPPLEVLELFGNFGEGMIEGRVKDSAIQVGPKPTFIMQLLGEND